MMALFTTDEQINTITNNIQDNIKTPIFNSDVIPDNILKQISGYKWSVDYYNVISNSFDNQSTIDFSLDTPTVEYNRIKDMVLILDTPIDNNIAINVNGSGYVNAGIKPMNGDIFISRLIDGRLGIFTLTSVSRDTYNLKDIFKIDFKLYTIINSVDDGVYINLQTRLVSTLVYNDEYLKTSDKPLLTSQESNDRVVIKKYLKILIDWYSDKIISPEVKYTVSYKNDVEVVYHDPHVECFMKDIIGVSNLTDRLNTFGIKKGSVYSIFDMLVDDVDKLMINKYMRYRASSSDGSNPFLRSVYWSGVNYIIELTKGSNLDNRHEDLSNNKYYTYISNDSYIFDSLFYNRLYGIQDKGSLTIMEEIVLGMLNNQPIKISDIKDVMYSLMNSDDVREQYYYIPLLVRGLYYYNEQITYNQL